MGCALGTLEGALESLDVGDTVDEVLKGRLEELRDALQEVLDQAEAQVQDATGGLNTGQGLPEETSSSYAADQPSGGSPNHN